jgi:hypothetical protein
MNAPRERLKTMFDFLLEQYNPVGVYVEISPEYTVLPEYLKDVQLLNFVFNAPRPVTNLCVDDDGITCTMSFNTIPFNIVVRWPAVRGFRTEDFVVVIDPNFSLLPEPAKTGPKRGKLSLVKP